MMGRLRIRTIKLTARGALVGESHGAVRHPDAVVQQVREAYRRGEVGRVALARQFGISKHTIKDWLSRRRRKAWVTKTRVLRECVDE